MGAVNEARLHGCQANPATTPKLRENPRLNDAAQLIALTIEYAGLLGVAYIGARDSGTAVRDRVGIAVRGAGHE